MENTKNIYQKLQKMRVELQKCGLTKKGRNDYSKYDYFELSDFMPQINELQEKYNTVSIFGLESDCATLDIVNCENLKEKVSFSIPIAELVVKGANAIQNIGGLTTYCRRYLYMIAFEIAENDEFDPQPPYIEPLPPQGEPQPPEVLYVNINHVTTLKSMMQRKGVTDAQILERYKLSRYEDMTINDFKRAMAALEKTPDKESKVVNLDL